MNISKINNSSSIESQRELLKYYRQIQNSNRILKSKQEAALEAEKVSAKQKELYKARIAQADENIRELQNPQHLIDLLA